MKIYCLLFVLTVSTLSCSKDSIEGHCNTNEIDITLAEETNLEIANAILLHINEHRAIHDLSILQFDMTYATAYAVGHTKYMIATNSVNHDFFFKRKNGLIARGCLQVAENVAYGFNSATSVLNGWLNSPSHRNVIEGDYTHVGIGVLSSGDSRFYYTCIFYN